MAVKSNNMVGRSQHILSTGERGTRYTGGGGGDITGWGFLSLMKNRSPYIQSMYYSTSKGGNSGFDKDLSDAEYFLMYPVRILKDVQNKSYMKAVAVGGVAVAAIYLTRDMFINYSAPAQFGLSYLVGGAGAYGGAVLFGDLDSKSKGK